MLDLNNLSGSDRQELTTACSYIFSPELAQDDTFLKNLKPEMIKQAFRKKAKRYHPDLHTKERKEILKKRSDRFKKLQHSYDILNVHFCKLPRQAPKEHNVTKKVIAIGGAKGGIGKSIFAANLGVKLSAGGWKTVVADLDLGGANSHLYLGETYLKSNINDFLNNDVTNLKEIMIKSRYGPYLIGGDSSQLGSANIHFAKKLKLLKGLRNIDADYIIIDLGGDTSYNIIDFFLSADHAIVMTTCEPAAYLDAYNFIKVSLYRKLNRIFGAESKIRSDKNPELAGIIQNATAPASGSGVKKISELLESVRRNQPGSIALVNKVIASFSPFLVVNKVADESEVKPLVSRIQKVSSEMLSINVEYLGEIHRHAEIKQSASSLKPASYNKPDGEFSRKLDHMIESIQQH